MENKKIANRESYGEELKILGEKNKDVVVLDADLSGATKTNVFGKAFEDRFFNIGIAEQDMVSTAAGLSTTGKIPYVSSFAAFLAGRAYDQIRASVAYPKLNVKLCATHSGITVGEDGATHQMLEDISLMRTMPNMSVMSVSDDIQTRWAVNEVSKINGPVYLRLSRHAIPRFYDENQVFEFGKGIQHGEGKDIGIITTGIMLEQALKVKEILGQKNINVRVIDIHTIKPIDKELIIKTAKEVLHIVTLEDHSIIGGLGSAVSEVLTDAYPVKILRLGIEDSFGKSGCANDLLEEFNLSAEKIIKKMKKFV